MSEFLEYVLWHLQNSLLLVLLAGIVAAAVIGVTYGVHKKKYRGEKKFPWGKTLLLGFLAFRLFLPSRDTSS